MILKMGELLYGHCLVFTDETIRILIRTTRLSRIATALFILFHFYPDTDVRILIWICGIAA